MYRKIFLILAAIIFLATSASVEGAELRTKILFIPHDESFTKAVEQFA